MNKSGRKMNQTIKNKEVLSIIFISFLILLVQAKAQEEDTYRCYPKFECGEWGVCIDGLESRTCVDSVCGRRDIIERRFCNIPGCQPKIECMDWSECVFTERIENIFQGEVGFAGYHSRLCKDVNGCVEGFFEETPCSEFYELNLQTTLECGREYLLATDPASQRAIAKIDVDSWKEDKLDIVFVESETTYCSECFNGIQDRSEEEIDCGGECKPCVKRFVFPARIITLILWIFSVLFSLLFIREIILLRKDTQARYAEMPKRHNK